MSADQSTSRFGAWVHGDPPTMVLNPLGVASGTGGPLWFEGPEEVSRAEGFRQEWLALVTEGPSSSIYLHPTLALAATSRGAAPVVYAQRAGTDADGPLASLAVLAPK